MSNHLAISAVTYGLKYILENALSKDFSTDFTVSLLPLDNGKLKKDPFQLNVFLYRVTHNPAWRCEDLPTRRADGTMITKPQLALDLHYLLTAYGKVDDKDDPGCHSILGSAMAALHSRPILTRNIINNMLDNGDTPDWLKKSDLADQIELARFTPDSLNLEELSKLWSVFSETPYRVSVGYKASVVLIDGRDESHAALPVRDRNVVVMPFLRPHIESVSPQFATMNEPFFVRGQNLKGQAVSLLFGSLTPLIPPGGKIKNNEISVNLPAGLRAGVNTVRVVHSVVLPTGPHKIIESNTAAFMLRPLFSTVTPPAWVPASSEMRLEFDLPQIGKKQKVFLLLNQVNQPFGQEPKAYRFNAPKDNGISTSGTETNLIRITCSGVESGDYLIRARVDGAETGLIYNETAGKYTGPLVKIP